MMNKQLTLCFFFCVSARLLPEKLTVYTTLVGLLNARNYNFGGEFVEAMIRQLKECLKVNMYNEAVHLVSVFLFVCFTFLLILFLSFSFHLFVAEELGLSVCITVFSGINMQCTLDIPRDVYCVRSISFLRGEKYYSCKIDLQLYIFPVTN